MSIILEQIVVGQLKNKNTLLLAWEKAIIKLIPRRYSTLSSRNKTHESQQEKKKLIEFFQSHRNRHRQSKSMMELDPKSSSRVEVELLNKWTEIQDNLRKNIVTCDPQKWQDGDNPISGVKLVAGLDISYPKEAHDQTNSDAYAAVVICHYPSMEIAYEEVQLVYMDAPYIPGFLAFRESTPLLSLLKKVLEEKPHLKPDVLLIDGNGILHPQKCGVACHIGFHTQIPTIGVAKNLFVMDGVECTKKMLQDMESLGDYIFLRDKENSILGMALKTADKAKNPVYVSVGHNISLDTARKTVLSCCKYRVPEPLRFADHISREILRKEDKSILKPGARDENKS